MKNLWTKFLSFPRKIQAWIAGSALVAIFIVILRSWYLRSIKKEAEVLVARKESLRAEAASKKAAIGGDRAVVEIKKINKKISEIDSEITTKKETMKNARAIAEKVVDSSRLSDKEKVKEFLKHYGG